jgi:hypothetical protein
MNELMEAKKVTPVIDRTYKLSETAEAIRYLEGGASPGQGDRHRRVIPSSNAVG